MKNISAKDVKKAIDNKERFLLLDVRTKEECQKGMIEGAMHLPFDEVSSQIEKIQPDKNATIYVYCLSASRSSVAVKMMDDLGYQNAYNMEYGLMSWRMNNFPMKINSA